MRRLRRHVQDRDIPQPLWRARLPGDGQARARPTDRPRGINLLTIKVIDHTGSGIDQDIELPAGVQAGMASKGFDTVWLSDEELRVQHLHSELEALPAD